MLTLLEALREQEDGHDRPGGVSDHRDDAREEAHAMREAAVLREREELRATPTQDEVEGEEAEDDPADDDSRDRVVDAVEEQPADYDARDGGRHHGQDLAPAAALAVHEVAEQVGDDEHRQHQPDRRLGAEDLRHEDDVQGRGAGEARLRQSDAHRPAEGEEQDPAVGGQEGMGVEPVEHPGYLPAPVSKTKTSNGSSVTVTFDPATRRRVRRRWSA